MPGDARQAARDKLGVLFAEQRAVGEPGLEWDFSVQGMRQSHEDAEDKTVDVVLLPSLRARVGTAAWGRPISQQALGNVAAALNSSASDRCSRRWTVPARGIAPPP